MMLSCYPACRNAVIVVTILSAGLLAKAQPEPASVEDMVAADQANRAELQAEIEAESATSAKTQASIPQPSEAKTSISPQEWMTACIAAHESHLVAARNEAAKYPNTSPTLSVAKQIAAHDEKRNLVANLAYAMETSASNEAAGVTEKTTAAQLEQLHPSFIPTPSH